MLYGVIDIGSNTIRLCIYKADGENIQRLFNEKDNAGLAGYVEAGKLTKKGIARAADALSEFCEKIKIFELENVLIFATASLRNISNTEEVLRELEGKTGFVIDVLSGEDEARLNFSGATHKIKADEGLILDIGGGSTEIVAHRDGQILDAASLPIGSLSLYRSYVKGLLPTPEECEQIQESIESQLKKLSFYGEKYPDICVVGGTVRAASRLVNDRFDLPSSNTRIVPSQLKTVLKSLTHDENISIHKILQIVPERIHTLIPGILILDMVSKAFGVQTISVSTEGVREGYLLRHLRGSAGDMA